jgi:hypothetical protein
MQWLLIDAPHQGPVWLGLAVVTSVVGALVAQATGHPELPAFPVELGGRWRHRPVDIDDSLCRRAFARVAALVALLFSLRSSSESAPAAASPDSEDRASGGAP